MPSLAHFYSLVSRTGLPAIPLLRFFLNAPGPAVRTDDVVVEFPGRPKRVNQNSR